MILGQGAEAVLTKEKFLGTEVAVKTRVKKEYRIPEIDLKLRKERTRMEARLLHKAKESILCPLIYDVGEFDIKMQLLHGVLLRDVLQKAPMKEIGKMAAEMHSLNIVHGDFTPANIIIVSGKPYLIDFGLGDFSTRTEDKAVDILLMKKSLPDKLFKKFLEGYKTYNKFKDVMKRLSEIEFRGRYVVRAMAAKE